MFRPIVFAIWFGLSLVTEVTAQTFDGIYRGTRTITSAQSTPDCPGIGGTTTSIEFQVSGSTIILRYLSRSDAVFPGRVASDGTFTISTLWSTSGSGRALVNWTGRIDGTRIEGTLFGSDSTGECRGTLTARKRR